MTDREMLMAVLIVALGDRILEQIELLVKAAERRPFALTETDYCVVS